MFPSWMVSQRNSNSEINIFAEFTNFTRNSSKMPFYPEDFVKVARLQSEFCTKDFFEPRIFLRKMLRNFPRNV